MICEHETSEAEIGYDIKKQQKEWFCKKCGKLVKTEHMTKEAWNAIHPSMKVPA